MTEAGRHLRQEDTLFSKVPEIVLSPDHKRGDILLSKGAIADRLGEVASEIDRFYQDRPFTLVSVLNGGLIVSADLIRALNRNDVQLNSIKAQSYGSGTESSGVMRLAKDKTDWAAEKEVVLVDDVLDTGLTLPFLESHFHELGAKTVNSFVLLSKPSEIRKNGYEAKFTGFKIPNVWVEGYGMDSAGRGRGNPNVIVGPSIDLADQQK